MLQVYIPTPPLSSYIDCLWYINDTVQYQRERILPTGNIEIMLNFGAPFRVYEHDNNDHFTLNHSAWIAGFQTDYIINEPVAETHMMGIRLKPFALPILIDIPAHEFHNQIIDIDLIWGRFVHDLREQLYCLPTVQDKFDHLEQVLRRRILLDNDKLQLVEYAVCILGQQNSISVRDLCQHIGVSNKHLINLFKQSIGVTPKALSKVFRFQNALNTINPQTNIDWVEIAINAGYYDQSHFNKEFATFTGMSPSQYMTYRHHIYGETLEQGDGIHFVPVG